MNKPAFSRLDKRPKHPGKQCDPETNRTMTVPKEQTDINVIMQRARAQGTLQHVLQPKTVPMYHDCTLQGTFEEIQIQVAEIKSAFMDLPSHVRDDFNNDPGNMVKAVSSSDPEMMKYCQENKIGQMFGITYKEHEPKPVPAPQPEPKKPEEPKESEA